MEGEEAAPGYQITSTPGNGGWEVAVIPETLMWRRNFSGVA